MKYISLTQGKFAIVDDGMYAYLNQWKWHVNKSGAMWYAVRGDWLNGVRLGVIWMHRLIMNAPSGMFTDHINHCGLDNQCHNLRTCTTAQNGANRVKQKPSCFSIYKGVSKHKNHKIRKWVAKLKYHGVAIWLGSYKTEIEAARAYDAKAKELFGEFANLNFPE